jgi:hypothetical protein
MGFISAFKGLRMGGAMYQLLSYIVMTRTQTVVLYFEAHSQVPVDNLFMYVQLITLFIYVFH